MGAIAGGIVGGQSGGSGSVSAVNDLTDVVITSVADNEILQYDSGTSRFINQTFVEAGILANIVEDTTPQLGGALDGQSNGITSIGSIAGATTINASGDITGATLAATGDTSAGDNASIGYTAAEGLILTGQGSVTDVTIKNDTDATVLSIPTGTVNINIAGTIDGRDLATDGTKLDAIEASADVTDATNVTSAGALMDSEVTNLAFVKALAKGISDGNVLTANDVVADDDFLRISGTEVEGLTVAEVLTALNVEAAADVTDTTNVTSAGALMDSELTSIADVKALNQSVISGATPTFTTTSFTDATNKRLMTDAQETILDNTSNTNTGDEVAASVTVAGVAELAITSEIDTGTDSTRTMPVDQFQASKHTVKFYAVRLVAAATDVATATTIGGDWIVPFNGTLLQSDTDPYLLHVHNDTAGITGTQVVDVHLNGTTIMTTNKLDTDTTEKTSGTGATLPDLTTTTISAGDILTFDIDTIHSGTAAKGLTIYLAIRLTTL